MSPENRADHRFANNNVSTQAGSGDVTPAAAHRPSRVAGGTTRTDLPAEGAAPVIEAAKRDQLPAEPASDKAQSSITDAEAMAKGPIYRAIIMRIAAVVGFTEKEQIVNLPIYIADLMAKQLAGQPGGKTINIAACPFCGYDDVEIEEIGHDEFAITCPECKAIGPSQSSTMASITGWNERKAA